MLSSQSLQASRLLTTLRPPLTQVRQQVDQLKAELDSLENRLATQGSLPQMTAFHLQDSMNKQAQIMQILSNLMKTWHAQASTMISNLR